MLMNYPNEQLSNEDDHSQLQIMASETTFDRILLTGIGCNGPEFTIIYLNWTTIDQNWLKFTRIDRYMLFPGTAPSERLLAFRGGNLWVNLKY